MIAAYGASRQLRSAGFYAMPGKWCTFKVHQVVMDCQAWWLRGTAGYHQVVLDV